MSLQQPNHALPPRQPNRAAGLLQTTRLMALLSAALLASACATLGGDPHNERGSADAVTHPAVDSTGTHAAHPSPAEPATAAIEKVASLDAQTLYQVLLGEIAFQRGEVGVASGAYADAARRTGDLDILTRAIQIAGAARRYDLALELTERWVALEPTSVHGRQALLGILAALGRADELQEKLAALLADDPPSRARNILNLNRLFGWEPDRSATMQRIYTLTAPYLDLAESHYTRAGVAHSAGDQEAAVIAVRRASELRFDWQQPWLLEIQILGRERAAEATERLDRYLKKYPEAAEIRMQKARLLATQKRWPEARAEFLAVADDSTNSNEALHAVGLIAMQEQDYDAAEEVFRKLLDSDFPDKSMLHHQLGLIAEEKKDYSRALSELRQVGDGEYHMAAQSRIAIVLGKQGNVQAALDHLHAQKAHNAQERQRLTLAEAQVLRDAKDYKSAFDLLSKALEREPDQPDLLYDHAMIAERIDRIDVLEGNLNRLITINPDNAHAYNALGYSLADRNVRLDEARRLIVKAMELAPDDVFILDSMGWVLFRLGDSAGALRYLERAYALRNDPEIAAHLGEVLWVSGRREEATRIWREARKHHADNEVLLSVIRKFLP